ncbi:MAG TPA: L-aspartate oxidase [Candidatus Xenobia bacterium]|nr:L-aspartate oxidase [Candidatus Xenobia bacterium]
MKARGIETDYVVVGCGIAGLRAAIELAAVGRVLVLSKAELTESATQYAQGGIAAALSDEDEVGLHLQDTLKAGDGLCNEAAVKVMVEEGPRYIQELIDWGTAFDREGTKLAFTREGAHSRSRVLHAHGDSTGRELARVLLARARTMKAIEILPYVFTTDVRMEKGRVAGVNVLGERQGRVQTIRASAVLLATGGLGQVYSETTNPSVATGDGVAIAYRAGAALRDMEFIQFHPTALYLPGAPRFLLSEALRGEGGILRNVDLERFMPRYHEAADLAPRDIVSRAIMREKERTGADFVYLDMTKLNPDRVRARFPRIYQTCLQYNLDITTDLIPVRPAAHYSMGGVATDLEGRTTLPGLYAAGEVACNGVHGANRLASNSLLDGLVFGARAGQAMVRECPPSKAEKNKASHNSPAVAASEEKIPAEVKARIDEIRTEMWKHAGIIRKAETLRLALERLRAGAVPLPEHPGRWEYEEQNMRTVAEVIVRSALAREESRGAHYRSDFAFERPELAGKHSLLVKDGEVKFE